MLPILLQNIGGEERTIVLAAHHAEFILALSPVMPHAAVVHDKVRLFGVSEAGVFGALVVPY